MNKIWLLIGFLALISCANREILLPQVSDAKLQTDMKDYSPVYIFFDEKTHQADLNRKSTISTTNWVFSVDRRLTLLEVAKNIEKMQRKRAETVFHTNPDAENFFSVADTSDKKLKFIPFTKTKFYVDYEQNETKVLSDSDLEAIYKQKDTIQAIKTNRIYVNGNVSFQKFVVFLQQMQSKNLFLAEVYVKP